MLHSTLSTGTHTCRGALYYIYWNYFLSLSLLLPCKSTFTLKTSQQRIKYDTLAYTVAGCIAYCCAQIHTWVDLDLDIGCGCGCGCCVAWSMLGVEMALGTQRCDTVWRITLMMKWGAFIFIQQHRAHTRQPYYIYPIYQFIEFSACK